MNLNVRGTKGARMVDAGRVRNVATPGATSTWQPVGHGQLIDTVTAAADRIGMVITGEEHFLGKGGNRYFGRLRVAPKAPGTLAVSQPADYGFFVGLRNSLDKSYASALGFGTNVFVCSNGVFSAEYTLNRKHTPEILTDLPRLTDVVMSRFCHHQANVRHRFDVYKHTELLDVEAHDIIIRAAEAGATNYRQVPTIVKQWRTPDHNEFSQHRNAWRLFNAFTEAAKMGSEEDLWDRSLILQNVFDNHCGYTAPEPEVLTSQTPEEVAALN